MSIKKNKNNYVCEHNFKRGDRRRSGRHGRRTATAVRLDYAGAERKPGGEERNALKGEWRRERKGKGGAHGGRRHLFFVPSTLDTPLTAFLFPRSIYIKRLYYNHGKEAIYSATNKFIRGDRRERELGANWSLEINYFSRESQAGLRHNKTIKNYCMSSSFIFSPSCCVRLRMPRWAEGARTEAVRKKA